MGFTLPKHLKDILKQLNNLADDYKIRRKSKDDERYFNLFRSATKNPKREQDAEFIENIAAWVETNKAKYYALDSDYYSADYSADIVPFLKRAISGMLMIELIKIYGANGEKATDSALGELLLGQFNVKKFQEVPIDTLVECLEDLEKLIDVINKATQEDWIDDHYRDVKLAIATALKDYEVKSKIELS